MNRIILILLLLSLASIAQAAERLENYTNKTVLVFTPQYPIQDGLRYRAVARIPGMAPIAASTCRMIFLPSRSHLRCATTFSW